MLQALFLALGFPIGIYLMLFIMAALEPPSDRTPKRRQAGKGQGQGPSQRRGFERQA